MTPFMEKINSDPALKEKWEAILKKHEATRDRDAAMAELSALAQSEGFDGATDEIFGMSVPKGELSEEELDKVSGGYSEVAICQYIRYFNAGYKPRPKKSDNGYIGKCHAHMYYTLCNWTCCTCYETSHCTMSGYHNCDENGVAIHG